MIRIAKPDLPSSSVPRIDAIVPDAVLPGGEVELQGSALGPVADKRPLAVLDGSLAPVLLSRPTRMNIRIPESAEAGRLEVRQNGSTSNAVQIRIGRLLSENVNPVTSPVTDAEGNIYTTLSGPRGEKLPVSIYRISPEGDMDAFATDILNPTGLALDTAGVLYVSSRHEGTLHRITPQGASSIVVESMGVATGLAFDPAGNLYCGDRSGTIFKIARDRQIFVFATLEPSVSAYHLVFGLDGTLFVTGPPRRATMRSTPSTATATAASTIAGWAGPTAWRSTLPARFTWLRRIADAVGLAFSPSGSAVVATHTAIYDVALGVEGLRYL